MDLYTKCIEAVKTGTRVLINLKEKNLTIGYNVVIKKGKRESLKDINLLDNKCDLDKLYLQYKYSCPSEHSLCSKAYLPAMPVDKLTDGDMIFGLPRDVAQVMLEAYILLGFMSGKEKWENESQWFKRSNVDKEFILLREWA